MVEVAGNLEEEEEDKKKLIGVDVEKIDGREEIVEEKGRLELERDKEEEKEKEKKGEDGRDRTA